MATVLVGSTAALAVNAGSSIAAATGLQGASEPSTYEPRPLADELAGARSILSEDPYVDLARGERAVVVDAFMFIRLARLDPALVEPLLVRLAAGEFDAVVLTRDVREPDAETWYREFAFGSRFYEIIRDNYRLCSAGGGYFLYVTQSRPCPGS